MPETSSTSRSSRYPAVLAGYVGLLVILAAILTVILFVIAPPQNTSTSYWISFAIAGLVLHILNQLNFNIRFSGQKDNIELTFSEAGLVATFYLFEPGMVTLLSGVVHLIRELQAHRPSRIKVVFNTSEIMVSVGLAGLVYYHVMRAMGSDAVVPAMLAAMLTHSVSNRLLVGTVISLSTGGFQARYFHSLFVENVVMLVANLALGMTAVMALILGNSVLLWVPVITLGVVYLGYQAYVAELRNANTLARLYENALVIGTETEEAMVAVALSKALDTFGTLEVTLFLAGEDGEAREWRLRTSEVLPTVTTSAVSIRETHGAHKPEFLYSPEDTVARPWRLGSRNTGMAAPVQYEERLLGVLQARKPRAWDAFTSGDLRAFSLFARQLGAVLENARLQELGRQQKHMRQRALDAERNRISRDLHDSFVQTLVQVDLHLEYLQRLLTKRPEDVQHELASLQGNVREGLLDARHYMAELKPLRVAPGDFVSTVHRYVNEFGQQNHLNTSFNAEWIDVNMSEDDLAEIFQILREGLNNVVKHAEAQNLDIHLTADSLRVVLIIKDDGKGFETSRMNQMRRAGHFGLANITERASGLGGYAQWASSPGNGTKLTVSLPRRVVTDEQRSVTP